MKSAMQLTGGLVVCLVLAMFMAGWRTRVAAASSIKQVASNPDKPETNVAASWDPKAAGT